MSFGMPTKDTMKEGRCNGSVVMSSRNHGKVPGISGVDARNGKADEDGGKSTMEDSVVDENEVSEVSLLAEKQSQLEEVFNRHDTLVCHSFVRKCLSITLYRYEKHFIWKTSV